MVTWLAPFITLLLTAALFFASRGTARQQAMLKDINFYIVCIMAVAIISIIAGARYDPDWTDTGTWITAAIAAIAILWRWARSGNNPDQTNP